MADFVFQKGVGAVVEKIRGGANIGILLAVSASIEADSAMRQHETVTALLGASTTEAAFTNYVRKTVSNGSITVTEDASGTPVSVDIADLTWTDAGGASNETLGKLVIYEDTGGSDTTRVPLIGLDFSATTDGNDLIAQFHANGIFRATA